MVQPQDFNLITTHTVNGDVIFVQDQFTGADDPACPYRGEVAAWTPRPRWAAGPATNDKPRPQGLPLQTLTDMASSGLGPYAQHTTNNTENPA